MQMAHISGPFLLQGIQVEAYSREFQSARRDYVSFKEIVS